MSTETNTAEMLPDYEQAVIYTIPHTGTRFIKQFFSDQDIVVRHRHVHELPYGAEWKRIIVVRNPYDCWRSWTRRRGPIDGREGKFTTLEFVSTWAEYIMRTEHQSAFYIPLDIDPTRRVITMVHMMRYLGIEPDHSFVVQYCNDWRPIGPSMTDEERQRMDVPDDVYDALGFAFEWYVYYTENPGVYQRNEGLCRLGENTRGRPFDIGGSGSRRRS
jgi:hypothetical protein